MDIGSILLGLALLLVIAFLVARPLLERPDMGEQFTGPADQLLGRREQVLTQLRDLDFDSATGKINAEDYAAQRAQLVAEGVATLKQLDELEIAGNSPVTGLADAPADEIEAAVRQLRARRTAPQPRPAAATTAASRRNLDAEIEATVAQRRSAVPARPAAAKLSAAEKLAQAKMPEFAEKLASAEKLACVECGTEVLPSDRFCPKCGSPMSVACGNCGRMARAGDQFCAQCGQSLPATVAPGQPVRPANAHT